MTQGVAWLHRIAVDVNAIGSAESSLEQEVVTAGPFAGLLLCGFDLEFVCSARENWVGGIDFVEVGVCEHCEYIHIFVLFYLFYLFAWFLVS